jgi:hypothetical protein
MQPHTSHLLHFTISRRRNFIVRLQGTIRSGKTSLTQPIRHWSRMGMGYKPSTMEMTLARISPSTMVKRCRSIRGRFRAFPRNSLELAGTIQANLSGAEHHTAAADHHEQAARHHGQASKHYDAKEYAQAAHETQIALGHAQHSVFHGDEAAKHHVEHFGNSGPTDEIS